MYITIPEELEPLPILVFVASRKRGAPKPKKCTKTVFKFLKIRKDVLLQLYMNSKIPEKLEPGVGFGLPLDKVISPSLDASLRYVV